MLQTLDKKITNLNLFSIQLRKYVFDGSKIEGNTKFLGKLIDVLLIATKRAADSFIPIGFLSSRSTLQQLLLFIKLTKAKHSNKVLYLSGF